MTHLRTPRFWLLTTAALILGSATTAQAQSYQMGAPTMVAAAPGFPSIPAEQIARDVTTEFNPRTGARELMAAPFDPFEEDPALAGSLRLRSADGAVDINGRPLRDGALVELDFYYNSPSDDPYGGRNYGDVSFVNGELAPVVLRDTRVLECSTRVENVVYDHTRYYDRGFSPGIYRPYRHYAGHSGFGFGFGNSYFGPGYGHYGSRRGYGYRSTRGTRFSRPSTSRRVLDAVRNRDRDDRSEGRRNTDALTDSGTSRQPRVNARRLTDQDIEERLSRVQSYGTGRTRADVRRNERAVAPSRAGNASQRSRIRTAAPTAPPAVSQSVAPQRSEITRGAPRQAAPVRSERRRSETRRSETRRSQPRRSEPTRSSNTRSSSRPKKASSSRRISTGGTKNRINNRIRKNFFPNDGYGGRSVVSSRSVDCAREDKLRIFIPNERLDAARFDGLTLIALDARGGETPIYLPANYIEGYRLAATGRVRPQGVQTSPQYTPPPSVTPLPVTPRYGTQAPRTTIEPAPCPSGTRKNVDGTCLQIGTAGYPTR